MTLTPHAKKVIDLAYQHANQLGDSYIGTGHLLLGIMERSESLAARKLSEMGATLEEVRRKAESWHESEGVRVEKPPFPVLDAVLQEVYRVAQAEARKNHQAKVSPEVFFLALTKDPESPISQLLIDFGLDLLRLREAMLARDAPSDD